MSVAEHDRKNLINRANEYGGDGFSADGVFAEHSCSARISVRGLPHWILRLNVRKPASLAEAKNSVLQAHAQSEEQPESIQKIDDSQPADHQPD